MSEVWVSEMYGIVVEKKPIPRPGGKPFVPVGKTGLFNAHTTEGYGADGVWATLNQHHSAPHFIAGENRIIQCRPLGMQGAALLGGATTNGIAEVQAEIIGFSQQKLWQLRPQDFKSATALLAYCNAELGIPLTRPAQWPDDLSDMAGEVLATSHNSRRRSGMVKAGYRGIAMHLEFPLNNHWDCGALKWVELIEASNALIGNRPTSFPIEMPEDVSGHIPLLLMRGSGGIKVAHEVRTLQKLLGITQDGQFGPDTEESVKAFQTAHRLTPDGKVGPKTWAALLA